MKKLIIFVILIALIYPFIFHIKENKIENSTYAAAGQTTYANIINALNNFSNRFKDSELYLLDTNKFLCTGENITCEASAYNNIGLINKREFDLIGINSYLKTIKSYWTMTEEDISAYKITSNGIGLELKTTTAGIRPVVYLKNEVKIVGSGMPEDPYLLVEKVIPDFKILALYVDGVKTDNLPLSNNYILNTYNCNTSANLEWEMHTKKLYIKNLSSTPLECTLNFISHTMYADGTGANPPELASNMIPVLYNGSEWVKADIMSPWYNYANKEWANVVLVKENGVFSRDFYLNAPPNTPIVEEDILMYYVWIPRYAYQITSGYHTNAAGTVSIKFLTGTTNTTPDGTTIYTDNLTDTHHSSHPAFDFGGTPIKGFWVLKYEATGTISTACTDENCTTAAITSIPTTAALRSQTAGSIYYAVRSMERSGNEYGFNSDEVDTHVIKNIEWGAVAFLTQSIYGNDAELWINPNTGYKTGCAGGSVNSGETSGCNIWNTVNGQKASTTGNVTGIYDMKGGSYDFTMGNLNNTPASAGIDPTIIPDKYIDRYAEAYSVNYYGDAVFETSSTTSGQNAWYIDNSVILTAASPWQLRGHINTGDSDSGIFAFRLWNGGASSNVSFRPVLIVGVD